MLQWISSKALVFFLFFLIPPKRDRKRKIFIFSLYNRKHGCFLTYCKNLEGKTRSDTRRRMKRWEKSQRGNKKTTEDEKTGIHIFLIYCRLYLVIKDYLVPYINLLVIFSNSKYWKLKHNKQFVQHINRRETQIFVFQKTNPNFYE